jgi:hypothetical protein
MWTSHQAAIIARNLRTVSKTVVAGKQTKHSSPPGLLSACLTLHPSICPSIYSASAGDPVRNPIQQCRICRLLFGCDSCLPSPYLGSHLHFPVSTQRIPNDISPPPLTPSYTLQTLSGHSSKLIRRCRTFFIAHCVLQPMHEQCRSMRTQTTCSLWAPFDWLPHSQLQRPQHRALVLRRLLFLRLHGSSALCHRQFDSVRT